MKVKKTTTYDLKGLTQEQVDMLFAVLGARELHDEPENKKHPLSEIYMALYPAQSNPAGYKVIPASNAVALHKGPVEDLKEIYYRIIKTSNG